MRAPSVSCSLLALYRPTLLLALFLGASYEIWVDKMTIQREWPWFRREIFFGNRNLYLSHPRLGKSRNSGIRGFRATPEKPKLDPRIQDFEIPESRSHVIMWFPSQNSELKEREPRNLSDARTLATWERKRSCPPLKSGTPPSRLLQGNIVERNFINTVIMKEVSCYHFLNYFCAAVYEE